MYVKRTLPVHFPTNYNGNLSNQINIREEKEKYKEALSENNLHKKYKVKKNVKCLNSKEKESSILSNASSDDILLLGLIIFLYVGCEHSKENIILIGVLAYLLLGDKLGL
ncbi:MAG: hypothetical protein E7635_04785 [Ruminococcaceae bacterium]|nr:hypothetical protein [Oscillospiraceae bacterium]